MVNNQNSTSPPPNALAVALRHLQRATGQEAPTGEYWYTLAQAEFMAGSYRAALEACGHSTEADPTNYAAWLLTGEAQLRLNAPRQAWQAARAALKLDPRREDAWLLAARAALQSSEFKKAVECLELYLKQPRTGLVGPLAYILLARVYLENGQANPALEQLEQAQARLKAFFIAPGPSFLALRARVLRGLSRWPEAVECYRQIIQAGPPRSHWHNEMGETLREQGEYDTALRSFRQASQLEPDNPFYYYQAGRAALLACQLPHQPLKLAEGQHRQALQLLDKATRLDPGQGDYWYELAQAHRLDGNYKQMKQALTEAIGRESGSEGDESAPSDPRPSTSDNRLVRYLRSYAVACQKLGDFKAAYTALYKILTRLPDDHPTLYELGELAFQLGDNGAAFNYFRRAEKLDPDQPRYLAGLSRVLLKLERWEEAYELIEEAARQAPDDYRVQAWLGAVLVEIGNPAEAIEPLSQAVGQELDNPEFRYYLGRAYLGIDQIEPAIHEYQEAVANSPLNHQWHAELGELYLRERAYLPALESLRLAAQLAPDRLIHQYNLALALGANGDLLGALRNLEDCQRGRGAELASASEGGAVTPAAEASVGAEWYYLMGRLQLELGRLEDSFASFDRAAQLEPANPYYKVDLARSLRLKGAPIEEARNLLEEAIEVNPQGLRSFEELAYVYEAQNEPEAALRTLEQRLDDVLETVLQA